ncbi:hypothetical protein Y032_0684g1510 [Ancylostoma ceylanicum]|uniref:Uncharacterized protein n=1 Tax=Ancylostoma ceylanicum TaxID=53326 RepID=A0A016WH80_9BILA|nr:hypothetical protein Y032_0684g1510 [Ancylostoma ceylanicum]
MTDHDTMLRDVDKRTKYLEKSTKQHHEFIVLSSFKFRPNDAYIGRLVQESVEAAKIAITICTDELD